MAEAAGLVFGGWVFAYYGQSGWAVANLVVAAASMGFVLPFANFILDTTFTLFRRLIRRDLHPGRSCGADCADDFRDRGDRLRRSLGMG